MEIECVHDGYIPEDSYEVPKDYINGAVVSANEGCIPLTHNPIGYMAAACHEIGHMESKKRSFLGGEVASLDILENVDYQSVFRELIQVGIPQDFFERILLGSADPYGITDRNHIHTVVVRLFDILMPGALGQSDISMYSIDRQPFIKEIVEPNTASVGTGSSFIQKYSKEFHDHEVPALYVEYMCLLIFERIANAGLGRSVNIHVPMCEGAHKHPQKVAVGLILQRAIAPSLVDMGYGNT